MTKLIVNELEKAAPVIIYDWLSSSKIKYILTDHNISIDFFKKHFAFRIYDTFITILKGESGSGDCPAIHALLHFCKDKYISLAELFVICSKLKNSVTFYCMQNIYNKTDIANIKQIIEVFDLNFVGVMNRYVHTKQNELRDIKDSDSVINRYVHIKETTKETIQSFQDTPKIQNKVQDDRLTDIRFSKHERYNSQSLFEMVDHTIIDKIEQFLENLDELLVIFYDIEKSTPDNSHHLMQDGVIILNRFCELVDTFVVFPVIARTFQNLSIFLINLDIDFYKDIDKKNLLSEHLIGLINDLEQWINIVFIKKVADDVHYMDASFANNVLEIESIVNQSQIVTDDDDLEFF